MIRKPAKGIAWFRTEDQGRYAGKLKVIRYFQVCVDGSIQVLDVSRNYLSKQRSFGGIPVNIVLSSKQAWTRNINKLVSNFKQTL